MDVSKTSMTSIGYFYQEAFSQELKKSSFNELQDFIQQRFEANHPFWIARMSGIESAEVGRYYQHRDYEKVRRDEIQKHSGIFIHNEESLIQYVNYIHCSFALCDRLAIWDGECYKQCGEMYEYCKKTFPHTPTIPAHVLEPYYFMQEPMYRFPQLFKDKKILIVTSHATSIQHQIGAHLDEIFHPYEIFPQKENIQVYRTVQQSGGNCDRQDWSHHFKNMCDDISLLDFDVAFIGCGGFSNVLGHYIRSELNRSAIYVGGPLQLYFGIMGRRWLWNSAILSIVHQNNTCWIKPFQEDYVQGYATVEEGCYWM